MVQLIVIEKEERTAVFEEIEQQIISHLVPKDRDDAKDVVLEVRAGTGTAKKGTLITLKILVY